MSLFDSLLEVLNLTFKKHKQLLLAESSEIKFPYFKKHNIQILVAINILSATNSNTIV